MLRPVYAQFTSRVNLVEVYATVTDRSGQPVTGLSASDFHVREDGRAQEISTFAAGDFPLSIAIALDRSFSMAGERLVLAKEAARAFIARLRPDDEVMVLAIGGDVETITPPVSAREAAATRWDAIDAWGTTPLYDITMQALETIQTRRDRRALLLISDGIDRYSDTSAATLIDRARQSDVIVYPIAIGQTYAPVLAELASVTGGRLFAIKQARELGSALDTLARELRFQYLVGYMPVHTPSDEPRWRSIEVDVDRADVRVRARDGYFSK